MKRKTKVSKTSKAKASKSVVKGKTPTAVAIAKPEGSLDAMIADLEEKAVAATRARIRKLVGMVVQEATRQALAGDDSVGTVTLSEAPNPKPLDRGFADMTRAEQICEVLRAQGRAMTVQEICTAIGAPNGSWNGIGLTARNLWKAKRQLKRETVDGKVAYSLRLN
jgi:hypothetical protein